IPVGATNIVAMTCGDYYNIALRGDGKLFIWGYNQHGELNTPTNLGTPIAFTTIGSVNPNAPGTYQLSYSSTNTLGPAAPNVRTVVVADTLPPTVTVLGQNPYYVTKNAPYTDQGVTATDLCAGDLTSSIQISGTVNTSVLGTNILSYYVSDSEGHYSATNNR